ADRCAVSSECAWCLHDAIPELTCRLIVADHRPIDYDLLLQDARPFDERSGDPPPGAAAKGLNHSTGGESRRISRTLHREVCLLRAARKVSGQPKEEIDALGGVGESPGCRCHQRGNHEGSQSAHYVDTVLHCEQPGRLSPQRRRREPQSFSCPSPPLASGATSGPGRPTELIVRAVGLPCHTCSSQVPMRNGAYCGHISSSYSR